MGPSQWCAILSGLVLRGHAFSSAADVQALLRCRAGLSTDVRGSWLGGMPGGLWPCSAESDCTGGSVGVAGCSAFGFAP